jgi:preprotein translocase subunit SecG
MEIILLVIHILISIALVLIILAQTSKGNGLDSSLGGAASNVFGSSASNMMKKWTQIIGGLFLVSCVFLAITVKSGKSVKNLVPSTDGKQATEQTAPAQELNLEEGDIQEIPATDAIPATVPETVPETKTESPKQ